MTTSVLRTADAWWVQTPTGAARIATTATTTARTARRPRRHRPPRPHEPSGRTPRAGLPRDRALPGRRADDELRIARQGRRHGPEDGAADVLPQVVGIDQRPASTTSSSPHTSGSWTTRSRSAWSSDATSRSVPRSRTPTWPTYIAGLVVTNDVSARDIQLPQTQFYEAKSYPTFTPVGPALVLLDADELNASAICGFSCASTVSCARTRSSKATCSTARCRPCSRSPASRTLAAGRPRPHRHPRRHRAERPAEADRDHRGPAAARGEVEGVLQAPGQEREVPARTATSSSSVATDDGAIDLGTQRSG